MKGKNNKQKNRNSEKIGNSLLDVIQKNIIKKSNMSVNKKKHEKSKSQFFKNMIMEIQMFSQQINYKMIYKKLV